MDMYGEIHWNPPIFVLEISCFHGVKTHRLAVSRLRQTRCKVSRSSSASAKRKISPQNSQCVSYTLIILSTKCNTTTSESADPGRRKGERVREKDVLHCYYFYFYFYYYYYYSYSYYYYYYYHPSVLQSQGVFLPGAAFSGPLCFPSGRVRFQSRGEDQQQQREQQEGSISYLIVHTTTTTTTTAATTTTYYYYYYYY